MLCQRKWHVSYVRNRYCCADIWTERWTPPLPFITWIAFKRQNKSFSGPSPKLKSSGETGSAPAVWNAGSEGDGGQWGGRPVSAGVWVRVPSMDVACCPAGECALEPVLPSLDGAHGSGSASGQSTDIAEGGPRRYRRRRRAEPAGRGPTGMLRDALPVRGSGFTVFTSTAPSEVACDTPLPR